MENASPERWKSILEEAERGIRARYELYELLAKGISPQAAVSAKAAKPES